MSKQKVEKQKMKKKMKMIMKMKMMMKQCIKTKKIKDLNDNLDEIIDKSKSFEDQIRRSKRVLCL